MKGFPYNFFGQLQEQKLGTWGDFAPISRKNQWLVADEPVEFEK